MARRSTGGRPVAFGSGNNGPITAHTSSEITSRTIAPGSLAEMRTPAGDTQHLHSNHDRGWLRGVSRSTSAAPTSTSAQRSSKHSACGGHSSRRPGRCRAHGAIGRGSPVGQRRQPPLRTRRAGWRRSHPTPNGCTRRTTTVRLVHRPRTPPNPAPEAASATHPRGKVLMKLLLTSSGISNPSISDSLVELLGKPIAESSALFIPTAIYPFPGGAGMAWQAICGRARSPLCELGWKSLGVLELTALSTIREENWVPMVREADALLVWGGDVLYLCHWMRRSGLANLLPSLGEAVYVGVRAWVI